MVKPQPVWYLAKSIWYPCGNYPLLPHDMDNLVLPRASPETKASINCSAWTIDPNRSVAIQRKWRTVAMRSLQSVVMKFCKQSSNANKNQNRIKVPNLFSEMHGDLLTLRALVAEM